MSSSSSSALLSKSLRSAPSSPPRSSPSIPVSRGEPSSSSPNAPPAPSRPTRARAQAVLATATTTPEAGPSTRRAQNGIGREGEASASDGSPAAGKGKTPSKPEKRVLPARIRRAAGGGAEGIRDLEEMIVDWLERWGAPLTSPPDDLPIILTTLPLPLVDPPTTTSHAAEPAPPAITLTPTRTHRALTTPSPRAAAAVLETSGRIEVPDWVMVRAGEDDREEAKEELTIGRGRGVTSPVKRLRKAILGDEIVEDTSDAYYASLHRKFEVFERRQRIREKEKLQFERYKMRSRIDLLRGMSAPAWTAVVSTVLSRAPHPHSGSVTHNHGDGGSASERGGLSGVGPGGDAVWAKGREKIRVKGVEWLRTKLVREGEEVMKRYDQLLPNESKKPKADSRTSTPTPSMRSPSLSPAPVLPPRVAALRDATSLPKKRTTSPSGSGSKVSTPGSGGRVGDVSSTSASDGRRGQAERTRTYSHGRKRQRETSSDDEEEAEDVDIDADVEVASSRPSRVAKTKARRRASQRVQMEGLSIMSDSPSPARSATGRSQSFAPSPSPPLSRSLSVSASASATPGIDPSQPPDPHAVSSSTTRTRSRTPFFPPLTASGLPILVEAACRREESIAEATASRDKVAAGRVGRLIAREKTRASTRLGLVSPFGMPFPAPVEWKSEFTLSDEEDFWPIIADREAQANHIRRSSLLLASPALSAQPTTSVSASSVSVRGTEPSTVTGESTGAGAESGVGLMVALEPVSADEAREMREVEAAVVL